MMGTVVRFAEDLVKGLTEEFVVRVGYWRDSLAKGLVIQTCVGTGSCLLYCLAFVPGSSKEVCSRDS